MRILPLFLLATVLAAPTPQDRSESVLAGAGVLVTDSTNGTHVTNNTLPTAALTGVIVTGFNVSGLRFRRPVPKNYSGNFAAVIPPPACLQANHGEFTYGVRGFSEDCLFLNVLAPLGSAGSEPCMPVMVWIHGGGFIEGDGMTFLSPYLVRRSVDTGNPVVLVTINYRLGMMGFGMGRDMAENNAENLGLHDQLMALEWVKRNIAGFGGDPTKVTVFGQSAGAISIAQHYLNESIDLFRGAIMMSGQASSTPMAPTSDIWEEPYNVTAIAAGCLAPNITAKGNLTTFECLRAVSSDTIVHATAVMRRDPRFGPFVFTPSIDGDLVPDRPWVLLKDGHFAKIPYIAGDTRDEGTWIIPTSVNSSEQIMSLFHLFFPIDQDPAIIQRIFDKYPNVPEKGSPFGTGNETFGMNPAFKQGSAIAGDMVFHSRRRKFLRRSNDYGNNQTWTYEFRGPTPNIDGFLGIPHSSDVPYVFGVAVPENNYTAEAEVLGQQIMDYWINFATYLDPNGDPNLPCDPPSPYWPPHGATKDSMRFDSANLTVVPDTFREDQMAVFDEPDVAAALLYKRHQV
ncbi:hypothetical protein CcaverHIS641_0607060 [Cutaneotrichosporon cavernicola]|nr:hypothetical protein CcaverHIS641_0607060 [Cutaneotrichosporon cavernicola]